MTLTFEFHIVIVKMNQHVKYLEHVVHRTHTHTHTHAHIHTHRADCCIWIKKIKRKPLGKQIEESVKAIQWVPAGSRSIRREGFMDEMNIELKRSNERRKD